MREKEREKEQTKKHKITKLIFQENCFFFVQKNFQPQKNPFGKDFNFGRFFVALKSSWRRQGLTSPWASFLNVGKAKKFGQTLNWPTFQLALIAVLILLHILLSKMHTELIHLSKM